MVFLSMIIALITLTLKSEHLEEDLASQYTFEILIEAFLNSIMPYSGNIRSYTTILRPCRISSLMGNQQQAHQL